MTSPLIRHAATLFLVSGASYWFLEWGYRHLIAVSPPLTPIVEAFPLEAMHFVMVVWFLLIAVPPSAIAFAIAFGLRRGLSAIPPRLAIALAIVPVLLLETRNQFLLWHYEDVWRVSIFNIFRFAFAIEFVCAFVAGLVLWGRREGSPTANFQAG